MAEVLYAPNREQVITSNAWAFLHWLRTTRGVHLAGWTPLQHWSVIQGEAFREAIAAFASPMSPLPLTLVRHAAQARDGSGDTAQKAELLLHADLRPDDGLLVAGPWIVPENAPAAPAALLEAAAEHRATVLVAPAQALAEAAFRRNRRPDLRALRAIIATGGPMSPEARRRIYTWVKPDIMLLARSGDTFWGNPLEPVLAQPPATPAFLTPRPSAPPPR